ncbi:Stk1 family PASTA domain-containing Ser/Thr kinase [Dermacoccaceae bacterium W4C1]
MSTASTSDLVGEVLDGRYEVLSHLADGGMATVYVAMDHRLDRPVALKVMRRDLAGDEEFVARFRREARAAARLSHPNVVGVYDQGQDGDHVFLAMELVRGRTLRSVIRSDAPLTPRAALDVLIPVLQALSAAHRADIVHRDVKPENVLIGEDGVVKVADFGLARALTTDTLTTNQDILLGTAAYLSPEQVEAGRADKRSDVYAAALVLHEMLTGTKAVSGDSPIHVAYQQVHGPVPSPRSVVPELAPELDALVALGAAKDPQRRPADAAQYLAQAHRTRTELSDAELDLRPATTGRGGEEQNSNTHQFSGPRRTERLRHPPAPHGQDAPARGPRPSPNRPQDTRSTAGQRPQPGRTPTGPGEPRPHGASATGSGGRGPARWVGLAVVLLLVLGGTGWWFQWGPGGSETVPSVAGQQRSAAVSAVQDAGLSTQVQEVFSETVPSGVVVSSSPAAGADSPKSDAVVLRVSKGPERYSVPAVTGVSRQVATQRLTANNLTVGAVTEAYSETIATGAVVSSTPTRATRVKRGTAIALVISKGREPITVPVLTGRTIDEARSTLTNAGLTLTEGTEVFDDTIPQGSVVSQSPSSGTLNRGEAVTLTISKGPEMVKVPDVKDKNTASARSTLEAAGLKVTVRKYFGGLLDTVRGQDPNPGTEVRKGSTVTISVV